MKNKIYKNDHEGLVNYLTDINNEFIITSNEGITFERKETDGKMKYDNRLVSLVSNSIKSTFSVLYQPNDVRVRLVIDEFEVIVASEYIGKHEGTVSNFQCKCPQREIFVFLKEFVSVDDEINFIEIENKANQFVKRHILEFVAEVFSNQIVLGNKWTFKSNELKNLKLNFKKIIK